MRALTSSVGKKFVMGITGLLLCGFLVIHLAGNLLLYVGAEQYNHYAHSMHSQEWLVNIAEVGLLALFVAHLFLAIRLTLENRAARQFRYDTKQSKQSAPTTNVHPDSWMFISGAVVLAFLLVHLADFRFELRDLDDVAYKTTTADGEIVDKEPFDKAVALLQNPVSNIVYIIGSVLLAIHLSHGFASAFQSLGMNHPKYNGLIRVAGIVFAIVIGIGFASFALCANFLE